MSIILKSINNFKKRRFKINRASISYSKSKNIGLLYTYIDENKQRAINNFVSSLKKDGKRVDLLPAIQKKMLITDTSRHLKLKI